MRVVCRFLNDQCPPLPPLRAAKDASGSWVFLRQTDSSFLTPSKLVETFVNNLLDLLPREYKYLRNRLVTVLQDNLVPPTLVSQEDQDAAEDELNRSVIYLGGTTPQTNETPGVMTTYSPIKMDHQHKLSFHILEAAMAALEDGELPSTPPLGQSSQVTSLNTSLVVNYSHNSSVEDMLVGESSSAPSTMLTPTASPAKTGSVFKKPSRSPPRKRMAPNDGPLPGKLLKRGSTCVCICGECRPKLSSDSER